MENKEKEIKQQLQTMSRKDLESLTLDLFVKTQEIGLEGMKGMNELLQEKRTERKELLGHFGSQLEKIKVQLQNGEVEQAIILIDNWIAVTKK